MGLGRFITGKAATEQSDKDGLWYTLHNQLFMDEDGQLYLVPRNFKTDGYTIPLWIAWLGGGKMQWDIRPAIEHDFECKFHQEILVKLTIYELMQKGLIRNKTVDDRGILICENIPAEYLELRKVNFSQVNGKFKRMMKATNCIKSWRINMMRFCVNFNPGWIATRNNSFDLANIYKKGCE